MLRKISISNKARKYINKLSDKKLKAMFQDTIKEIRLNPYIGELKTGDLAGVYCCDFKYARTNYEIAYILEEDEGEQELVIVILAGTRENFYEELKKHMKS